MIRFVFPRICLSVGLLPVRKAFKTIPTVDLIFQDSVSISLRDRLEGDTAHLSETTGPLPRNCRWTVMISHLVSVSL